MTDKTPQELFNAVLQAPGLTQIDTAFAEILTLDAAPRQQVLEALEAVVHQNLAQIFALGAEDIATVGQEQAIKTLIANSAQDDTGTIRGILAFMQLAGRSLYHIAAAEGDAAHPFTKAVAAEMAKISGQECYDFKNGDTDEFRASAERVMNALHNAQTQAPLPLPEPQPEENPLDRAVMGLLSQMDTVEKVDAAFDQIATIPAEARTPVLSHMEMIVLQSAVGVVQSGQAEAAAPALTLMSRILTHIGDIQADAVHPLTRAFLKEQAALSEDARASVEGFVSSITRAVESLQSTSGTAPTEAPAAPAVEETPQPKAKRPRKPKGPAAG